MFYTNRCSPVKLCFSLVTIETHTATSERWQDVAELFERKGPRGGTPQTDGCWCQFWRLRGNAHWEGHGAGNRAALEDEVRSGAEPGLLAYVGGRLLLRASRSEAPRCRVSAPRCRDRTCRGTQRRVPRGLPRAAGPHEHRRVYGLPADVPRRRL